MMRRNPDIYRFDVILKKSIHDPTRPARECHRLDSLIPDDILGKRVFAV
jgi:hypothetical protein